MRNGLGWIITIGVAAILGLGAALGVGAIYRRNLSGPANGWGMRFVPGPQSGPNSPVYPMGPGGMMNPGNRTGNPSGTRISIEKAIEQAQSYSSTLGADLHVSEVMEFSDNFYAVVKETSTGRGAMELLIDPSTGSVFPEYGPNMMWNSKYSPMGGMSWMIGGSARGDNNLSLDQAVQDGQQYLDTNIPGAKLEADGISFYGHYTFDYTVNGQIGGMLSVNGGNGSIWLHTWHGAFVQETEVK
jgi:hypothetical protein